MANALQMTDHEFESRKNVQAATYTAIACGLLLAIFMLNMWEIPAVPTPPVDEGIEVNLGSSDKGFGKDQPLEPGEPAPAAQQKYVAPTPEVQKDDNTKEVITDDKDEEAPVVKKPPVTKHNATKLPDKEVVKKKPQVVQKVTDNPPPPPEKKPKTLMPKNIGGNGTGGNLADSYKKGSNEGIAGGTGDQGQPGGNPDAKSYTGGGTGNSGVRISKGLQGRYFTKVYSYRDEFNENATVAVDVKVDKSGNVLSATFQLRGSTTSEDYYREKAVDIVKKSRLNANASGPDEQTGTVLVNFKVRG